VSTNAAEWIMAAATVATGVFVAYQSYLLRQSLDSPFGANLQERQIAACAEAIKAHGALGQIKYFPFESLKQIPSGDDSAVEESEGGRVDDRMVIEPEVDKFFGEVLKANTLNSFTAAADSAAAFRSSLAELRVYSSESTTQEIDAVENALPSLGLEMFHLDSKKDIKLESPLDEINGLDKVKSWFLPIERKCRATMLGESKGLI
jgi:hypothetical protein